MCCWEYLDCACDWTKLSLLYKLLRFWWEGVEIYLSCGNYPRKVSILLLNYDLCIWSGLTLSLVSRCPLYIGASLQKNNSTHIRQPLLYGLSCAYYTLQKHPYQTKQKHSENQNIEACNGNKWGSGDKNENMYLRRVELFGEYDGTGVYTCYSFKYFQQGSGQAT